MTKKINSIEDKVSVLKKALDQGWKVVENKKTLNDVMSFFSLVLGGALMRDLEEASSLVYKALVIDHDNASSSLAAFFEQAFLAGYVTHERLSRELTEPSEA